MRRLKVAAGISLALLFTPLALAQFGDNILVQLGVFLFWQYPGALVQYIAGDQGHTWMAGGLAWALWSALTYAVLWLVVDVPAGDKRNLMTALRYIFAIAATLVLGWALLSSVLTLVVFAINEVPPDLTPLEFVLLGPLAGLLSSWRALAIGAVLVIGWRLMMREYSTSGPEGEPA